MKSAWVYTLKGCEVCSKAIDLVTQQGYHVYEVEINNPLLEQAVAMLFTDHKLHAPVVVIPELGIYILDQDGTQLFRIVNMEG